MANNQEYLNQLTAKFEALLSKQEGFAKELMVLHKEIERLKKEGIPSETVIPTPEIQKPEAVVPKQEFSKEIAPETPKPAPKIVVEAPQKTVPKPVTPVKQRVVGEKSNLEKFIGENLLSKIGIAILIIGIAVGAKYSIENNLISPLTRIILGYVMGLGLMGVGIKLKKKYNAFSAVMVSGAIAILYFITFAAYSFYGLFPQSVAFGTMAILTVFAVIASLNYDKPVIAHLGLVGAYAVPFLLGDGSGKVAVLFSYMAIINTGILVLSFKKEWKSLFYTAFSLTWIIFISWYLVRYDHDIHFTLSFTFAALFFVIFYVTFMAYQIRKKEPFGAGAVIILLLNSFFFYGIGCLMLNQTDNLKDYLGLFTLANAVIHFIAGAVVYKQKIANKSLLYFVLGLVFVFITIAIPVQLDGNFVTLLWVAIAALLYWIGRSKNSKLLEILSYPLLFLALCSLIDDWGNYDLYSYYVDETKSGLKPFLNINLLSSLIFVGALGFMNFVRNKKYKIQDNKADRSIVSHFIPALLLIVLFGAFFMEIWHYWHTRLLESTIVTNADSYMNHRNYDLNDFKIVWMVIYSLFFVSTLALINIKKIKSRSLGITNIVLNIIALFVFLTVGLLVLSDLRSAYLSPSDSFNVGGMHIGIRYITFAFVALLLYTFYMYGKQAFMRFNFKVPFSIIINVTLLWVLSSELIHWMDISGSEQSYGLGLSILWAIYSFILIVMGIWKRRKYLRVGGITLFGITTLKLFFYDLAGLNTISKTIVLVILGLLIIGASFLYNKFTNKIFDDEKDQ